MTFLDPNAPAWDETEAIRGIRKGAVAWERGSEDTCLLTVGHDQQIVVTSDQINERQAYPGEDLRSLVRRGVNEAVSDVAAAGAELYGVQIDVRAPDNFDLEDFVAIGTGVYDVLQKCGGQLLQASNMSRGEFGISTTAIGKVPSGTALRRSTAKLGDALFLSGPVGGWDAALAIFNAGVADSLDPEDWTTVCAAFLDYRPELTVGTLLRESGMVSACIDANDCLPKACMDLAKSSDIGLTVDTSVIPVAQAATVAGKHLQRHPLEYALNGLAGDDRLLFTISNNVKRQALHAFAESGFHPIEIGTVTHQAGEVQFVGEHRPRQGVGQRPQTIYEPQFASTRRISLEAFPPAGRVLGLVGVESELGYLESEEVAS